MKKIVAFFCVAIAALGTACDRGEGRPPVAARVPPSTSAPQTSLPWQPCEARSTGHAGLADVRPGGYWYGTMSNDAKKTTDPFWLIATDDGRFRSGTYDYQTIRNDETGWVGTIAVDGETLDAVAAVYKDDKKYTGTSWVNSNRVGDVTFAGTIAAGDNIRGDWADTAGGDGCFEVFYSAPWGDPILNNMTGVWTAYGNNSTPLLVVTVDAAGGLFGQGALGCTLSGDTTLIDDYLGIFEIRSTISGCPAAGIYAGIAKLDYVFGPERSLWIHMDNGKRGIRLGLSD